MNNLKRWFLILIGSGLAILLLVGMLVVFPALAQGPGEMMGRGMMGGFGYNGATPGGSGPGWMMGYTQNYTDAAGTMPCSFGYGMMNGGMMGQGMMGGNSPLFNPNPLTLAEATNAINTYLAGPGNNNLALEELMIFDNHAYGEIVEKDTDIGAMELLVDPVTKAVYPEMGPNMMWNIKYGMMSGFGGYGMMGRMMGQTTPTEASAEMPVSPGEAVEIAQAYLDTYVPGNNLKADESPDTFYGYYTLHLNRDGETVGMLSVNGYTRQVFLHTWHGDFVEMSGE